MSHWTRTTASAVAGLLAMALGGCDLFEVDNPTNIIDEELEDEQMLEALGNTPEGAFSIPYDNVIVDIALTSDEGTHHSTRTSRIELFQGKMEGWNERYDADYDELQQARWLGDDMLERLERLVETPESDPRVAHAAYWGALSRLYLAELFEEVPIDGGPPQPPAEVLEAAVEGFQKAARVAEAAGETNLAAAALGSLARTHRALYFERGEPVGDFERAADAAGRALSTAPEYRLDVRYQQPGSSNGVFGAMSTGNIYDGMDPRYANRIDPVSGAPDPRIEHTELLGTDGWGRNLYEPLKYASRNDDIPASRWQEAELILAEYHVLAADPADALPSINRVRSAVGLENFESSDAGEIYEQLRYERATEFWLEGRRLQDMRYWGMIPPEWSDANKARGWARWPVSIQEKDTNEHYEGG